MNIKSLKIVSFLVFLFAFTFVFQSSAWATKVDKKAYGFSLDVPSGWTVQRSDDKILQLTKRDPNYLFQVAYSPAPSQDVTQAVCDIVSKSFKDKFSKIVNFTSKVNPFRGLSACWFKIEGMYTPTKKDSIQQSYVMVNGKWSYIITMHSDKPDWSQAETQLQAILNQMQFSK